MNNTTIQTMSSRETADLTGKQHKYVLEDIRPMLDELGLHSAGFLGSVSLPHRTFASLLQFPKRDNLILVSSYPVILRSRIIDRWQELQAQVIKRLAVPTT